MLFILADADEEGTSEHEDGYVAMVKTQPKQLTILNQYDITGHSYASIATAGSDGLNVQVTPLYAPSDHFIVLVLGYHKHSFLL